MSWQAWETWWQWAGVNGFILLFLTLSWSWNLPDGYLLRRFVDPFRGVILYSGLWHGWNMFAPEPLMVNRKLSALIYFADGRVLEWEATDLARMSIVQSFFYVRDRKYQDNLMSGVMPYLRPALGEWLWRQVRGRLGAGDGVPEVGTWKFTEQGTVANGQVPTTEPAVVTRIEVVLVKQLVQHPDKLDEPWPAWERHVVFTYIPPPPPAKPTPEKVAATSSPAVVQK